MLVTGVGVFHGMRLTSKLDHVKPTDSVLVATINRLQDSIVGTEGRLRRNVAHAQKHLQDIGKTVGLVEVVGGTLVKRPLKIHVSRHPMAD